MRIGERIQLVFIWSLALAAWLRTLELTRQVRITLLAFVATVVIAGVRFSSHWISPLTFSVLEDWLPAAIMLVPYWQVGNFFTVSNPAMEARLANFDRALFSRIGIRRPGSRIAVGVATYLQISYFLVYPLVPLGIVVLYTTGLRSEVDFYWLVVLSATYLCFAITPFVPAFPPRRLPGYKAFDIPRTYVGDLNHSILNRASIQIITFPSAHVASSFSAALVLLHLEPWAGTLFVLLALSIGIAAIVAGYHYVADVLFALATTTFIFLILLHV